MYPVVNQARSLLQIHQDSQHLDHHVNRPHNLAVNQVVPLHHNLQVNHQEFLAQFLQVNHRVNPVVSQLVFHPDNLQVDHLDSQVVNRL